MLFYLESESAKTQSIMEMSGTIPVRIPFLVVSIEWRLIMSAQVFMCAALGLVDSANVGLYARLYVTMSLNECQGKVIHAEIILMGIVRGKGRCERRRQKAE
jgi:hypothetical protein